MPETDPIFEPQSAPPWRVGQNEGINLISIGRLTLYVFHGTESNVQWTCRCLPFMENCLLMSSDLPTAKQEALHLLIIQLKYSMGANMAALKETLPPSPI